MSLLPPLSPPPPVVPDRRRLTRRRDDLRLLQLAREVEASQQICDALSQYGTVHELVEKALASALELVQAEAGSVILADPLARQFVFSHSIGVKPVPPGTRLKWNQGLVAAVYESGQPELVPDVKHDGRHFPGIDELTGYTTRDMIVLPLKRPGGQPIGVMEILNKRGGRLSEEDLGVLTIISGITTTTIEQARVRDQAKLSELTRLLANIGHDVRNMLTPMLSAVDLFETSLLKPSAPKPSPAEPSGAQPDLNRKVVEVVREAARRIQDRIGEISDFVQGVTTPPIFVGCSVADIVGSVFKTLGLFAEQRGVTLVSEKLEMLPRLHADERRLYTAFYNLVNNAIPETPRGGRVVVRGQDLGDALLLTVTDTGRGMTPDVRDSLFTARTISHKPGGTGLGTKIVKDIIDAHGGAVWVESAPGEGTTISLRLPIRRQAPS
jgi:signal transduction histidine kinase